RKEEKKMEKTKKLQLEDFTENGFYGTQEQQYLKAQVREELKEQGFIIDSSFEGDFKTWIGVYARPKDKPTYLDPQNDKEAEEQEQYSINGFKQDFSEWRSEEHTSELQSRFDLVCRLLLEKKNTTS